jgi:hypothetical protein
MRACRAAGFAIAAAPATPAAAQTLTTIATNGAAGIDTNAPLLLGAHGKPYGTRRHDGHGDAGEVFELTPPAPGQNAWT